MPVSTESDPGGRFCGQGSELQMQMVRLGEPHAGQSVCTAYNLLLRFKQRCLLEKMVPQ